jgi:hypothetical protein
LWKEGTIHKKLDQLDRDDRIHQKKELDLRETERGWDPETKTLRGIVSTRKIAGSAKDRNDIY